MVANDIERSSSIGLLKSKRSGSFCSSNSDETSGQTAHNNSMISPRLQLFLRSFQGPFGKRRALFLATLIVGVLQLVMKVTSLVLFCTLDLPHVSFFASWIVFTGINLLLLCQLLVIISIRMIAFQRRAKKETALSKLEPDSHHRVTGGNNESFGSIGLWGGAIFIINICASIFIAVTGTVYLANTATLFLSSQYHTTEAIMIGFESTDCALSVLFMGLVIVREWLPFAMVAQALTVVVSVLNFLISILTIWSNESQ